MRQKDNHGIWNERNRQKSENGRIRKGTTTDVIKRKKINVCGLRSKRKKKHFGKKILTSQKHCPLHYINTLNKER